MIFLKDEIIVRQKPVYTLIYAAGALAFILALGYFILAHFGVVYADFGYLAKFAVRSKILLVVWIFGFLFFFWAMLYYLRRIFTALPLLIADESGVTDNSSPLSVGFIPWEDIRKARTKLMGIQPFILITVKNEEKYLAKISLFGRVLAKANKRMGYEIICINLNTSGVNPMSVCDKIENMRKAAKK